MRRWMPTEQPPSSFDKHAPIRNYIKGLCRLCIHADKDCKGVQRQYEIVGGYKTVVCCENYVKVE